ncbi:MAG: hypothetical protein RQ824_00935 [bacterium]|nr:hypothetical protein [bacterium]
MKRLALLIALMVMTPLSASGVLAQMDEGAGKMDRGEKYEMMAPGGEHMMGPGIMRRSSSDCWMGGGMMGGHMHGWTFIGFGFIKVVVIGLFFWLLFRIARALDQIAENRKKDE